jgi:rhodanese-related sulfurtransferase
MPITKGYKALLAEANAAITAVEPIAAIARQNDAATIFVDLRDPRELEREGKIPGAFHCPRGMLEFWIDPDSSYHKPIFAEPRHFVFYCASGWRSALATKTAQDMGLDNVAHLAGGFSAWKAASGPIETITPKTR